MIHKDFSVAANVNIECMCCFDRVGGKRRGFRCCNGIIVRVITTGKQKHTQRKNAKNSFHVFYSTGELISSIRTALPLGIAYRKMELKKPKKKTPCIVSSVSSSKQERKKVMKNAR